MLLLALAAALALSYRLVPELEWQGSPRWQLLYELIGAFIALQVAVFALSRFALEARRLPLFIGLAYLGAAISDAGAALVSQGQYLTPLVGQTAAVVGVWTAGRLALALFLCGGLIVQQYRPFASVARAEMGPAVLIGLGVSVGFLQFFLMMPVPGIMIVSEAAVVHRPWELVVGAFLATALPGYWRLYRRIGGAMLGSALVSLIVGIFVQSYMARSATLYDGAFNLASVLKVVSYLPLLVGLFVESVTLYRAQRKLTSKLEVAQAELRDYSRGLEKKVAERTRDLETRAKELEAFAYTVSHDLKAPLRGIQTYSQLLLDEYAARLDETGRRYVESACKAATNMKQFIDELLEHSRLGRREAQLEPVDVRGLVDSVLAERQADIERHHAQVSVDIKLPTLQADRAMLRQAIANLLDNAIKFSRHANPPRITVCGVEEDSRYVIRVADNGIGFDMGQRERIFQIFQRLHGPDEFEGAGIGLSTVKSAIEKHGGQVWAESQPGKGATFSLSLPKPAPGAKKGQSA